MSDYWFTSIGEIRQANRAIGHHWFDPAALRYFGCRVGSTVYGGRYFVTSEQDDGVTMSDGVHRAAWNGRRLYTVRMATERGEIETVGTFGGYTSGAAARRAAARFARKGVAA